MLHEANGSIVWELWRRTSRNPTSSAIALPYPRLHAGYPHRYHTSRRTFRTARTWLILSIPLHAFQEQQLSNTTLSLRGARSLQKCSFHCSSMGLCASQPQNSALPSSAAPSPTMTSASMPPTKIGMSLLPFHPVIRLPRYAAHVLRIPSLALALSYYDTFSSSSRLHPSGVRL